MKKYVIIALVAVSGLFSSAVYAQSKVAHINAQELVRLMPETEKAQKDIEAFAQTLDNDSKSLIDEYNKKIKDFEAASSGTPAMSETIRELKVKEIQEAEQRIRTFETLAREKIGAKQAELLKPVYDKARKAIEDVAKEKGYAYVIDSSEGILLVSPAADDILAPVKAKLGIK
jgi:outer membrane protein